jgi:hypothetical protein
MLWLLRFFWFFAAAIMLANVAIWRRALAPLAAAGVVGRDEVDRFARGAALWLAGPGVVLGLVSLWAGWPAPLCAAPLSFADAPQAATSATILIAWAALLWWVWGARGADFLARVLPALPGRDGRGGPAIPAAVAARLSPRRIRLAVTALVVASAVGTAAMRAQMRPPLPAAQQLGCPAPHGAA